MCPAWKEGKCAPPKSARCTRRQLAPSQPADSAPGARAHALPSAPHRRPHTRGRGESRIPSCPRPAVATAGRLITATKNLAYRCHVYKRSRSVCLLLQYLLQIRSRGGGGGNNGGHVLRETTSRSLCGLVYPSRTSERGVCEVTEFRVPLTRRLRCVFFIMCVLLLWSRVRSGLNTVQSGKPCARLLSLGLSQIKSA
jgi:hypothetical protein